MSDLASLRQMLEPLFPGLIGMERTEAPPERVMASLKVRADLCTTGGVLHAGARMAFADTWAR